MSDTPLSNLIRQRIRETGPLSVAEYMTLALGHPEHGYYRRKSAIGANGDFITAPEISQMFGELIGAWALDIWRRAIAPKPLTLVECGPGRGTLMADVLRTTRLLPEATKSLSVHLVETNRTLIDDQSKRLSDFDCSIAWHPTIDHLPDGPALIIANEFLDALPIRQFVRKADGWHEIVVAIDAERLAFAPSPLPVDPQLIPPAFAHAKDGAICEISPAVEQAVTSIATHIADHGGAALLIDYGHTHSALGETLQAVKSHAFADPLAAPGETDLTAHIDFEAVAKAAQAAGANVHGPVEQGAFLTALGLHERAAILAETAGRTEIDAAVHRLSDPDAMGALFKVLAITHKGAPVPAGFAA